MAADLTPWNMKNQSYPLLLPFGCQRLLGLQQHLNVSPTHPPETGQPQELIVISGALVGSPWLGSPPTG